MFEALFLFRSLASPRGLGLVRIPVAVAVIAAAAAAAFRWSLLTPICLGETETGRSSGEMEMVDVRGPGDFNIK